MNVNGLVGIPYRDRGRARDGADCWGLVVLVYAEAGIALPRYDQYEDLGRRERADLAAIIDQERAAWMPVESPQALDLVLLNVMGCPSHIGVVTRAGWMLHVSRGGCSVIERYTGPRWSNRIEGFYRYSGGPPASAAG